MKENDSTTHLTTKEINQTVEHVGPGTSQKPLNDEVLPQANTEQESELLDKLVLQISRDFVRRDGRYYPVSDPTEKYAAEDIKHVLVTTLPQHFPSDELSEELIKKAIKLAMDRKHSDRCRKIPIWNGKSECRPGDFGSVVFENGFATLNTWFCPAYRLLEEAQASTRMLDILLRRIMPQEQDRVLFKDWLAWALQNETEKPSWSIILYSTQKGTGKSTLIELVTKLFGEGNSFHCRSVEDVTGRFAAPAFEKKLITVEEVKLQQGTRQANAMKTFITERTVAVERKGLNMRNIQQCAVFMFTTNHLPTWLEEGERRFLVIETNHAGHSHGEEREQFAGFIKLFKERILSDEHHLAKIYKGLMQHKVSPDFNPHAVAFERLTTPVMARLASAGAEVQRERLEELLNREKVMAVPQEDLCRMVADQLQITSNRVKHLMNELQWTAEKKKWGGKDYARTIWFRPGCAMHNGKLTDARGQPVAITYQGGFSEEDVEVIEPGEPEDALSLEDY